MRLADLLRKYERPLDVFWGTLLISSTVLQLLLVLHLVDRDPLQLTSLIFALSTVLAMAWFVYHFRLELTAAAFRRFSYIRSPSSAERDFVEGPLDELDLTTALPSYQPRGGILDRIPPGSYDSGVNDELRRANVWAAVLDQTVREDPERFIPPGTIITTYGFFYVQKTLKLGVVHYLSPLKAFAAVGKNFRKVEIDRWKFPVAIRPWLPIRHSAARTSGNCWITFSKEGEWRQGVLTASHALSPKSAKPGNWVSLDVLRTPGAGRMIRANEKMDAAIVELDRDVWHGRGNVSPSSVIGYKPVRLQSSSGSRDGWITDHSGPTIFGQPGQEPLTANFLFINQSLKPGDSGCLVMDCEHPNLPPYLMYLGLVVLGEGRKAGYGLLLEQPRRIWEIKFFA